MVLQQQAWESLALLSSSLVAMIWVFEVQIVEGSVRGRRPVAPAEPSETSGKPSGEGD